MGEVLTAGSIISCSLSFNDEFDRFFFLDLLCFFFVFFDEEDVVDPQVPSMFVMLVHNDIHRDRSLQSHHLCYVSHSLLTLSDKKKIATK